jgi:hypothetical protein
MLVTVGIALFLVLGESLCDPLISRQHVFESVSVGGPSQILAQ